MVGFDHGPASDRTFQSAAATARNARYGKALFFIYLIFYATFVLLAAFRPTVMDVMIAGVNLAIWYGFALIVVALALALIYEVVCGNESSTSIPQSGAPDKPPAAPDEEGRR